ncbi:glycoside hydrolase family 73 protein [Bombilactobacillus mellis]|uniref:glycoside hydrolase family 73 protein n=1 Tax=Bombilactobacillus mellis TaxID=1218508 RepID=UPI00188383D4|nr:glycoside hydrolase family 73 protein [Bombilactobacillus mellis]
MQKRFLTAGLSAAILAGALVSPLAVNDAQADIQQGDVQTAHAADTISSGQLAATLTRSASWQQNFIQQIAPLAQQYANYYGLYPSVMIAQAILESDWGRSTLAQAPNNNYFGIKGDYNGNKVNMPTKEWDGSKYITIDSYFRVYPDMAASFADNGNKLRNGLSWSPRYYSGTWRENTSSYRDATAWLQGRYATDKNYASKLNNLITTYNLDQYDGNNSADTNSSAHMVVRINKKPFAYIYNEKGQIVYLRALSFNTDWQSDETVTMSGEQFYQVSTYEFVRVSDVIRIK